MLHSAWLYHPHARYTLLAAGLSRHNRHLLDGFTRAYGIGLDIVACEARWTAGLPTNSDLSEASWLRLLTPALLPATVERAVYLDADISVCGSLDALFATDLNGMPLAAMPDRDWAGIAERKAHRLDEESIYVNSGVLMFDLDRWRRDGLAEKILTFTRTTTADLVFIDQTALNVVLQKQIAPIARRWNLYDTDDLCAVEDPRIIHHSGRLKPWLWRLSPFYHLYHFHRSQTPWPFTGPPFPLREWSNNQRKSILALLGSRSRRARALELSKLRHIRRHVAVPALIRAQALARSSAGAPRL